MDSFAYRGGVLWCEDVPAAELARRFGTPLYVYSRATLEAHADRLAAAFAELRPLICFSVKSCPNIHVCRVLVERGSGLDVVSGGELERARLAGCPMDRVVYAGVGKTGPEIRAALGAGGGGGPIAYFNIESEPEFEHVARLAGEAGVRARGLLRVNPDVDSGSHAYTSTGRAETKFGVDLARAERFFERFGRDPRLALEGLHLHIGSPVMDPAAYVEALRRTLALADRLEGAGFPLRALDLGGGFGADYESGQALPASAYAAAIVPLLRDRVARGLRVILEPGRQIAANAGVLLARVLYVKEGGGTPPRRFVITDAGMHTLVRPALYGSFHFIWPAEPGPGLVPSRRAADPGLPGLAPTDVVGPICESGDFLARDRLLPPVKGGDLLAVFAAGAYGMSMASRYNSHPLPAEALVEGSSARLIRRRENREDMLGAELAPGA